MSSGQWFPGLMAELHHMKQDLMRLHFAYSPVSIPLPERTQLPPSHADQRSQRGTQTHAGQIRAAAEPRHFGQGAGRGEEAAAAARERIAAQH